MRLDINLQMTAITANSKTTTCEITITLDLSLAGEVYGQGSKIVRPRESAAVLPIPCLNVAFAFGQLLRDVKILRMSVGPRKPSPELLQPCRTVEAGFVLGAWVPERLLGCSCIQSSSVIDDSAISSADDAG